MATECLTPIWAHEDGCCSESLLEHDKHPVTLDVPSVDARSFLLERHQWCGDPRKVSDKPPENLEESNKTAYFCERLEPRPAFQDFYLFRGDADTFLPHNHPKELRLLI